MLPYMLVAEIATLVDFKKVLFLKTSTEEVQSGFSDILKILMKSMLYCHFDV